MLTNDQFRAEVKKLTPGQKFKHWRNGDGDMRIASYETVNVDCVSADNYVITLGEGQGNYAGDSQVFENVTEAQCFAHFDNYFGGRGIRLSRTDMF